MRTSKSNYNPLNEGAIASSSSPCPTPSIDNIKRASVEAKDSWTSASTNFEISLKLMRNLK